MYRRILIIGALIPLVFMSISNSYAYKPSTELEIKIMNLIDEKKWEEAIEALDKIIKSDGENTNLYLNRMFANMHLKNMKAVKEDYEIVLPIIEKYIEKNPSHNDRSYYLLGQAHRFVGENDKAVAAFDLLLKMNHISSFIKSDIEKFKKKIGK